jgi:hypothetical protein
MAENSKALLARLAKLEQTDAAEREPEPPALAQARKDYQEAVANYKAAQERQKRFERVTRGFTVAVAAARKAVQAATDDGAMSDAFTALVAAEAAESAAFSHSIWHAPRVETARLATEEARPKLERRLDRMMRQELSPLIDAKLYYGQDPALAIRPELKTELVKVDAQIAAVKAKYARMANDSEAATAAA